jgi:hypothetical protein
MKTVPIASTSDPALPILRVLLLLEAAGGLAVTIIVSLAANRLEDAGSDATAIRFAASGAFILAILAAVASRGVRRRRGWGWTLAALLQVLVAIGTGVAILTSDWHPLLLVGFAAPVLVMLLLSTSAVRRSLGQD